jgi:hypothetical protein
MKFQFVFGFILLILFFIAVFVGFPYVLEILKSNQFFNLSRLIPVSTSTNYFFSQPANNPPAPTSQPQLVIKISISSVSRFTNEEQISLRASYFDSGAVDITGFKIRSLQRGETIIGKGYALPQFDAAVSDIKLSSGESADIMVGASPLAGNFRVNNCFGWLNNIYSLGYSLNYCPTITINDLSGFGLDSTCQDLLLSTSSCRVPSENILNQQTAKCRQWVEQNFNYNSCVVKHRNDSDFYKGWKVYTGNNNQIFDLLHDKIELRDQAGLLIDSYEY